MSEKQEFTACFPLLPRTEKGNLSLLKTTPEPHYNREIISLNEFLNFDKFDMGYHVAESHLCHRICVTEGQLFTKLECLLYHKVNRYNNRLKTRKSFGSLKFYGLIITNSSLQNLNQQLTLRLWRETVFHCSQWAICSVPSAMHFFF